MTNFVTRPQGVIKVQVTTPPLFYVAAQITDIMEYRLHTIQRPGCPCPSRQCALRNMSSHSGKMCTFFQPTSSKQPVLRRVCLYTTHTIQRWLTIFWNGSGLAQHRNAHHGCPRGHWLLVQQQQHDLERQLSPLDNIAINPETQNVDLKSVIYHNVHKSLNGMFHCDFLLLHVAHTLILF